MIISSILAFLLTVLILIQNPKGNSKALVNQLGAKNNRSFLTKTTWGLAACMVLLALASI